MHILPIVPSQLSSIENIILSQERASYTNEYKCLFLLMYDKCASK